MAKKEDTHQLTITFGMTDKFVPSKYQQDIFDFIENGSGNLVVEACAGSGKTTTIMESLRHIHSDKRVLLTCFNKSIQENLSAKVSKGGFNNVEAATLNSLGLRVLRKNTGRVYDLDKDKYRNYLNENIRRLSSVNYEDFPKRLQMIYKETIIDKFLSLGRNFMVDSIDGMAKIAKMYGIEPLADEMEVALKLMKWGYEKTYDTIDFDDQIWLPLVYNLDFSDFNYDFIMVDEVQDLNVFQRELILRCRHEGTRIIAVGDQNQCIYGFRGSDPRSFEEFRNMPNTTTLPLSICYRCADSIVDNAKNYVPTIERNNDGRKGLIVKDARLSDVRDGDMILCRNNAPLFDIFVTFVSSNRPCRFVDDGSTLRTLRDKINDVTRKYKTRMLSASLMSDGLFPRLYDELLSEIHMMMDSYGIPFEEATERDDIKKSIERIIMIEVLAKGLTTIDELNRRLDNLKQLSNGNEGPILSTIHKAKGLENDRVFIACNSIMPLKSAKHEWEKLQEHNLQYVAYTRAKNMLAYLEEDVNSYVKSNTIPADHLKHIEGLIKPVIDGARIIPKTIIPKPTRTVDINEMPSLAGTLNNVVQYRKKRKYGKSK